MINYETLMLARTEITDDELQGLERYFDDVVLKHKGKVTLFDKWGKYKLSYPVQKNVYGVYVLVRYQVDRSDADELFKDLDSLFRIKYNEIVMRHVTVRLEKEMSSVYKHPEAIGSHGGTSNLDSFIKENKMEAFIDTQVDKQAEKKEEAESTVDNTGDKDSEVGSSEDVKKVDDVAVEDAKSEES